jgi:nonribosomal peptide synthetase DhbF
MLVLQNTPGATASVMLEGVTAQSFETAERVSRFTLEMGLTETASGLEGHLSYASQVFDRSTALHLSETYVRVLEAVASDPTQRIVDLPLLSPSERALVVEGFNTTSVDYALDRTVVDLFVEQAAKHPSSTAVVDGERELSYGELDAASNRLARYLIGLGVGPEDVVAVCLERSASLIVALLGIWKAGGAYLPLDPAYPMDRLSFMVSDAGARLVVTSDALAESLSEGLAGLERVALDPTETAAKLEGQSDAPVTDAERLAPLTPASLAYVIYTSGSTGTPKGVMVGQGNVVRLLLATADRFTFSSSDVWTLFHSYVFDFSVWEIWGQEGGWSLFRRRPASRRRPFLNSCPKNRSLSLTRHRVRIMC